MEILTKKQDHHKFLKSYTVGFENLDSDFSDENQYFIINIVYFFNRNKKSSLIGKMDKKEFSKKNSDEILKCLNHILSFMLNL